jgi:hypothetical protein
MKKLLALSAIVAIISMNSGCRKIEMDSDKVVSGSGGNGNTTEENFSQQNFTGKIYL